MKNWGFALLVIVLSFISCTITVRLTNMRIDSVEERVKSIEYDMQTHDMIIDEFIR